MNLTKVTPEPPGGNPVKKLPTKTQIDAPTPGASGSAAAKTSATSPQPLAASPSPPAEPSATSKILAALRLKNKKGIHARKIDPLITECNDATDSNQKLFLAHVLKTIYDDTRCNPSAKAQLSAALIARIKAGKAGEDWSNTNAFIVSHKREFSRHTFLTLSLLNATYNNPSNNKVIPLAALKKELGRYYRLEYGRDAWFRNTTQTIDDLKTLTKLAKQLNISAIPQAAIETVLQASDQRKPFWRAGAHKNCRLGFFQESCKKPPTANSQPVDGKANATSSTPLNTKKLSATEIVIQELGLRFRAG